MSKCTQWSVFLITIITAQGIIAPEIAGAFAQTEGQERDGSLFSSCREQLNAVFDLRLQKKKLTIDLDAWASHDTVVEMPDHVAEHMKRLEESGFPKDEIKRRILAETKKSGIEVLVDNLNKAAGGTGGGKSSGGSRVIMRRRGKAMVLYYLERPGYRFVRVCEEKHPQRVLEMEQRPDGTFRLVLMGEDSTVLLSQSRRGKLNLMGTIDSEPAVFVANSFPELMTQTRTKPFLEVFDKAGVSWPATPNDFHVKRAVASRLEAIAAFDRAGFGKLVDQLGGKDFEKREDATRKLRENYSLYKDLIAAELGNNVLSLEAKTRLAKLVKLNQKENELDQVIREFNLLNRPAYLVALMDMTPGTGKAPIAKQLEKITGQSLGTDVKAWENWLKSTGQKK